MSCVIKQCKSRKGRKEIEPEIVSFHRFPKDKLLRQQWISAVSNDIDWMPKKCHRVCSRHFESHCFMTDDKYRRLKDDARPTLFISSVKCIPTTVASDCAAISVSGPTTLNQATLLHSVDKYRRPNDIARPTLLISSGKCIPTTLASDCAAISVSGPAALSRATLLHPVDKYRRPNDDARPTLFISSGKGIPATLASDCAASVSGPAALNQATLLHPVDKYRRPNDNARPALFISSGKYLPTTLASDRAVISVSGPTALCPATMSHPVLSPDFPMNSDLIDKCAVHHGQIEKLKKEVMRLQTLSRKRLLKINALRQLTRRLKNKNKNLNLTMIEFLRKEYKYRKSKDGEEEWQHLEEAYVQGEPDPLSDSDAVTSDEEKLN